MVYGPSQRRAYQVATVGDERQRGSAQDGCYFDRQSSCDFQFGCTPTPVAPAAIAPLFLFLSAFPIGPFCNRPHQPNRPSLKKFTPKHIIKLEIISKTQRMVKRNACVSKASGSQRPCLFSDTSKVCTPNARRGWVDPRPSTRCRRRIDVIAKRPFVCHLSGDAVAGTGELNFSAVPTLVPRGMCQRLVVEDRPGQLPLLPLVARSQKR